MTKGLIVSSRDNKHADEMLSNTRISIVIGNSFLVSYIGSTLDKNEFLRKKVEEISTVEKLAEVEKHEPQPAYAPFTKSVQFRWSYF